MSLDSKHNGTLIPRPTCGAQDLFVHTYYDEHKEGYINVDAFGPPTPTPNTFLEMEHLHSVWVADDGRFRGLCAANRPPSSECM
jgi:hypothetical protein